MPVPPGSDPAAGGRRPPADPRGHRARYGPEGRAGGRAMRPRRLVVVGTMAANPYSGMAWMHMQITAGLRHLGHDAYYFEISSDWPYDPVRQMKVDDSDYALPYLARIADSFGLGDRWAYRRGYSDGAWFGLERAEAEGLLAHADAVFNVAGATRMTKEG